MSNIKVTKKPTQETIDSLGIPNWGIWTKEASQFPWTYDATETCYFLEGEVEVTPDGGAPVQMGKGDLVTFSKGMSCTWNIKRAVRKHYMFED